MNKSINNFPSSLQRNKKYQAFMSLVGQGKATGEDLVRLGTRCMRAEKIHPHFFRDHSLRTLAEYLTSFVLKTEDWSTKILSEREASTVIALFERRIAERVPVEYITQEAYYLGRKFYVNEHVLVPRSLMHTRFQDFLKQIHWQNYRVLDLCTGSGCIGITLALLCDSITVDLADISAQALEVARINRDHYGLGNRVHCVQTDLFSNIQNTYDLIITNPPYVPDSDYKRQPPEIKNEPALALKGGPDGALLIQRILKEAKHYLNPQGTLIAEVGYPTAHRLKKQYPTIPFSWYICRRSTERDSFIEKIISLTRYIEDILYYPCLDSVFVCRAEDLPASKTLQRSSPVECVDNA